MTAIKTKPIMRGFLPFLFLAAFLLLDFFGVEDFLFLKFLELDIAGTSPYRRRILCFIFLNILRRTEETPMTSPTIATAAITAIWIKLPLFEFEVS